MKSNWVFSLKRAKTRGYHEWAKENYFEVRNRQEEAGREEGETSDCGARSLSHCTPKDTAVFAQRAQRVPTSSTTALCKFTDSHLKSFRLGDGTGY